MRPAARPLGLRLFGSADYASVMMVANRVVIPRVVAGVTGYHKKNP